MKNLIATICLTVAVLLGSAGVSWGAGLQNGLAAAQQGDFATVLRECFEAKTQFAVIFGERFVNV